ncbi:MAG: choice-of-anchor E domain-containing protein [Caldilineaceae bacterium]|nr:choice-of-anchor E domain-containing protein [Caldilineaceae bacterium]MCB1954564.1 choice-of-anchor E domain-containing protein [Rhodocyclaceae bacterium]
MRCSAIPRRIGGGLALAVSIALAASPVRADLIVQTRNFSLADLDGGINGDYWHSRQQSALLQFDHFDAALGTLTGARWVIDSSVDGFARSIVTSTSQDNVLEGGTFEAHVLAGTDGLHGTGGAGVFSVYASASDSCVVSKIQGCELDLQLDASLVGEIAATDLFAFEGIGSFDQRVAALMEYRNTPLTPWSEDFSQLSMDSVIAYDFASAGGFGTLSLIYEYDLSGADPTPATVSEPPSALLIGLAGTLLAASRRRCGPAAVRQAQV